MRGKTASLSTTAKATFSDGSGSGSAPMLTTASRTSLAIPAAGGSLQADLSLPAHASGLVVFCHGSGSNRLSPRNRQVAEHLQRGGLATLLFDLERSGDTCQRHSLAALPPLQQRLLSVIDWTSQQPELQQLPLALYGASTGAALALMGAAERPDRVQAVVSRGGRPDLVFQRLAEVRCPVLLLVGEHDLDVLELNAWAAGQLQVRNELVVIPQASHLFSEPGSLDAVAEHTYCWLIEQFSQEPINSAGDL
jgi:putative phosphoribosyl transferase